MRRGCVLSCVLALAAGACTESTSPPEDEGCGSGEAARTLTVALDGNAPLELRVESCRRDADACRPLCTFIMERAGEDTFVEHCDVAIGIDEVTVTYAFGQWGCW